MIGVFDVGGTQTRFVFSKDGKTFAGEPVFEKTPQVFEEAIELFTRLIAGQQCDMIIVGVPGPLDAQKAVLERAPHLPEWVGKPLKSELEHALRTKVYIENDAALGALGEAHAGAGKGYAIVGYLALGTGVGGARIVDGMIDKSTYGFEPGHQIVGRSDAGDVRTLQYYVGGASLEQRYGKKPFDIDDVSVWEEVTEYLAIGLANTIVHWSPGIVVFGGSISRKIPLDMLEKKLKTRLTIFGHLPALTYAQFADTSGLFGALELASMIQNS